MFGFVIFMHTLVCILLATIILMQSGRGGGLTESFSAAESMFGARTNVVLVKATTVLASIFLVTCLTLAFYSTKSSKSLIAENMSKETSKAAATATATAPAVKETATAPASPVAEPAKKIEEAVSKPVEQDVKTAESTNPANAQPNQATNPPAPANPQ